MKRKAVLFDLDGTLVNSIPDISASMNKALAEFGLPGHTHQEYYYMVGNGAIKLTQRAVGGEHPELYDAVFKRYAEIYAGHCFDSSNVYAGITDMLDALLQGGYRLVVLSNKDDGDVKTVLNHYFDKPYFEIMRGRLENIPLKPAPDAALNIAGQMNLSPDDFWYLGDTPVDCATAQSAGMHFIGVTWGFRTKEEIKNGGASLLADTPEEALRMML